MNIFSTKDPLGTVSPHQTQFSFTNFIIELFSPRVGDSVLQASQLYLHQNEITVGLA
jgi:hypothetical protein